MPIRYTRQDDELRREVWLNVATVKRVVKAKAAEKVANKI